MSILLMIVMSGFITPVTEYGIQFAAGGDIAVEKELSNTLYRVDQVNSTIAPIFKAAPRKGLNSIDISPRSRKLLVTWFELGLGYSLDVMDFEGKVLKSMDGVGSAVFIDHAGTRMAFARSKYTHGEETESLGVMIYDFSTDKEEKILDTGLDLEWGSFDNSLYVSFGGEEAAGFRCDLTTKEVTDIRLSCGRFSPDGKLRYGIKDGTYKIFRSASQEVISDNFEMFTNRPHGTPAWMSDTIIMLPHSKRDLEDSLLFVETGKSLKAPGRILSVTDDKQFVYICKPGLLLKKIAMKDLEVLYEGKSQGNEVPGVLQAEPKN